MREFIDAITKLNESAPPGKKAEKFIKGHKKEFKKRYGKDWEHALYGTAWNRFGKKKATETTELRAYLALVESDRKA